MNMTTTAAVDSTFIFIIAFCFLLFALIIFFTILFAVRYRRSRHPQVVENPGNWRLEAAWIAATVVLVTFMFFYGLTGWNILRNPPPGSLHVSVEARQWSWVFVYANGRKSTSLVVPQGGDVALSLTSADVIHGLFIPAYRIKQDAVPGMKTRVWFNATSPGTADILCSQYCGQEHSRMRSKVFVVPREVFDTWMAGGEVDIPGLTS